MVSGSWSSPWVFIPLVTVQLHLPLTLQVAGIAAVWWTQNTPVRDKKKTIKREEALNRYRKLHFSIALQASLKGRRRLNSNKLLGQMTVIFLTTK